MKTTKDKRFIEWLDKKLSEPCINPYYDKDGNSPRATVSRTLMTEVKLQYLSVPSHFANVFRQFNGLETSIGWFVQIPIYLSLLPIAPIAWAFNLRRRAYLEYYEEYKSINT